MEISLRLLRMHHLYALDLRDENLQNALDDRTLQKVPPGRRRVPGSPPPSQSGSPEKARHPHLLPPRMDHPTHWENHRQIVDRPGFLVMPVVRIPRIGGPDEESSGLEPAHKGGVDLAETDIVILGELLHSEEDVTAGRQPEDELPTGLRITSNTSRGRTPVPMTATGLLTCEPDPEAVTSADESPWPCVGAFGCPPAW
jgi:hypothetical protein